MNTESAEAFLRDGCGRCSRYRTPSCKVHAWTAPLTRLRERLRDSALTETMKWGSPCYTLGGKNVVMLVVFKDSCALSFLKGAALDDPEGVLEPPGPNSRFARFMRFRSLDEVEARVAAIDRLLAQAIELERSGRTVVVARDPELVPEALQQLLDAQPALRSAFEALTPGRRRSHILHVAGAKQAATQARRAAACVPEILAGRGQHER